MARAPIREISGPSPLQGVAAPVNTYVRPADPAPSSLHQLAEGLSALDAGLGDFMQKRKQKSDELDKQRAIRDAYLSNGEGFDEAVKQGRIPPQESPSYMTWYKRTQGDVRGRQLIDQFDVAYNQWPDRNSGDPEKFKQFLGGFLKENVGTETDPEVLAGLNVHLEQIFQGGYANFTKDRADAVYGGALAAHGASLTDHIEKAEADGKKTGQGIDYDTLWGTLMSERDEALKRNLEKDVDGFLVDSVVLQAEESMDENLLTILDRKLPGKEYALSSDLEVRKKIDTAKDRIESKMASTATTLAAREEKEDKARHNALVADTLKKVSDDPNYQVPEDTLKELSKRDPEFRSKLPEFRRKMVGDGMPEDPEALLEAYSKIDGGAGTDYVMELRKKGVIKDPATLTKMLDRVHAVDKASQTDGILQSPAYKDMVKVITNATGENKVGDYLDMVRGLTDDGARALFDYRSQLLKWSQENPNAGILEREKSAMEIGKIIRDRIVSTPTGEQMGTYPQPDQQEKPEAAKQAPISAPAGPISEQPPVEQPPAEAPMQPTSPRDQAAEELAKKYNISPEAAHQFLLDEEQAPPEAAPVVTPEAQPRASAPSQEGPSGFGMIGSMFRGIGNMLGFGGNTQPAASPDDRGALPEDTRTRLTNLLQNPPMLEDGRSSAGNTPVAPLLDLLGNTEGTDKGEGYNETLGYGKFTGGKVNLESMTLDQIDQLQTQMLSHPENTYNASPVGRYQIVRQTLRSLRRDLGLSGDELFDRKMQNRLGMALLKRRGLDQWQSGKMTDQEFMRSLGQEWASLPGRQGALKQTLNKVKQGGPIQVASTDPEAGFREWLQQQEGRGGGGPTDLITSTKRGYQPDMEHLKPALKSKVSELQKSFGQSLPIVSGFRDTQRNAKAGGAKGSQHIHGNAVDIDVSHLSRADRVKLIQSAREQGFGGIGVYANSIHLDLGRRRAWGPSHSSDSIPAWARDALA